LVSTADPFTAYWAAMALAQQGNFQKLKETTFNIDYGIGHGDYVLSAVYQAAADTASKGARSFLLDETVFRAASSQIRWLAPTIARLLTPAERGSLLGRLREGTASEEDLLFAADVLLRSGERSCLDPVVALAQKSGQRLRAELLKRVRELVKPPELVSEEYEERMKFHREWGASDVFLMDWWQKSGGSVHWDTICRAYVVRGE
jgi:hypothetical protein